MVLEMNLLGMTSEKTQVQSKGIDKLHMKLFKKKYKNIKSSRFNTLLKNPWKSTKKRKKKRGSYVCVYMPRESSLATSIEAGSTSCMSPMSVHMIWL